MVIQSIKWLQKQHYTNWTFFTVHPSALPPMLPLIHTTLNFSNWWTGPHSKPVDSDIGFSLFIRHSWARPRITFPPFSISLEALTAQDHLSLSNSSTHSPGLPSAETPFILQQLLTGTKFKTPSNLQLSYHSLPSSRNLAMFWWTPLLLLIPLFLICITPFTHSITLAHLNYYYYL